jgi:hypothetical protein
VSDLRAADRQVLADLENLNTYPHSTASSDRGPHLHRHLGAAGGQAAVTTVEHPTTGAALAEAAALVGR